jgi:hypothetical protein
MRNDQSSGSKRQDVASRKVILRAFAAKLIADPEGGSKPAALPVSESVENAALIDAGAAGRARDRQGL